MKVKDAILQLLLLDLESEFIVQVDFQGTGLITKGFFESSAIFTVDEEGKRRAEKIGLIELTPELKKEGYTDEDVIKNGERVTVIHCVTSDWIESEKIESEKIIQ